MLPFLSNCFISESCDNDVATLIVPVEWLPMNQVVSQYFPMSVVNKFTPPIYLFATFHLAQFAKEGFDVAPGKLLVTPTWPTLDEAMQGPPPGGESIPQSPVPYVYAPSPRPQQYQSGYPVPPQFRGPPVLRKPATSGYPASYLIQTQGYPGPQGYPPPGYPVPPGYPPPGFQGPPGYPIVPPGYPMPPQCYPAPPPINQPPQQSGNPNQPNSSLDLPQRGVKK